MDASSSNPATSQSNKRKASNPAEYSATKKEFENKLWKCVTIIGGFSGGNYSSSGSKTWKCQYCLTQKSSSVARLRYHLLGMGKREQIVVCNKIPKPKKDEFIREYVYIESLKQHYALNIQHTHDGGESRRPPLFPATQTPSINESQIGRMYDASDRKNIDAAIGRLFFGCGMPFNIARSPLWKDAVRMINNGPRGYVPPSYEKIRTVVLSEEKARIEARLQDVRDSWSYTGVSILSDGWTDIAHRPLINILVSYPKGAMFLTSHDTSGHVKDANYLMGLFRQAIEQVGRHNVVQVITDSAANNVLAGGMLEAEYPQIFWTPCAVHCMNLLLKDLHGGLPWISQLVGNAKKIQQFIVNHSMSQAIYRKYACLQLLRCADTRFASQFIMIERMVQVKQSLREMVVSVEWDRWRNRPSTSSTACDEISYLIIGTGSALFWEQANDLLKLFSPIFEVLRLFDSDKPCMGDVFESLDQMRERLEVIFRDGAPSFDQMTKDLVWACSETRWKMLHSPLHSVAFALNPRWFHRKPWLDDEVSQGWKTYLNRFYPTREERAQIKEEFSQYINAKENFSHHDVAYDRANLKIITFWETYGTGTPLLQATAIHVLSQVSSSSACERNWSEYAFIHSMKRNRLGNKKAEDLVYVHSNLRLLSRASPDYYTGPHRMWDYAGSMDDGDDELPIEVLEDDTEALLYRNIGQSSTEEGQ